MDIQINLKLTEGQHLALDRHFGGDVKAGIESMLASFIGGTEAAQAIALREAIKEKINTLSLADQFKVAKAVGIK